MRVEVEILPPRREKYEEQKPFVTVSARSRPSITDQPEDLCQPQCLSFAVQSPSISTNPATYIPAPSISQKDLHEPQRCSFARLTEEESSASLCAQWGGVWAVGGTSIR